MVVEGEVEVVQQRVADGGAEIDSSGHNEHDECEDDMFCGVGVGDRVGGERTVLPVDEEDV